MVRCFVSGSVSEEASKKALKEKRYDLQMQAAYQNHPIGVRWSIMVKNKFVVARAFQ